MQRRKRARRLPRWVHTQALQSMHYTRVDIISRTLRQTTLVRPSHQLLALHPQRSPLMHHKVMHTWAEAGRATGISLLSCRKMVPSLNLATLLLFLHLLPRRLARHGIPRAKSCLLRGAEEVEQATLYGRAKKWERKKERSKTPPRRDCASRQKEVLKQNWLSHLVHCLGRRPRRTGNWSRHKDLTQSASRSETASTRIACPHLL